MKRTAILAAAMLLSMLSVLTAQTPDENELILWTADTSLGNVTNIAVHPNGNLFVNGNSGAKIYELNGQTGELIRELPIDASQFGQMNDISSDGKYLVHSGIPVYLYDLTKDTYKTIATGGAPFNPTFTMDSKKITYRIAYPEPEYVSSVVFYDIETETKDTIILTEVLTSIAFSPDGRFFATGGWGGNPNDPWGEKYTSLKLWDAHTLKLIKELAYIQDMLGVINIQFTDDSKLVAFQHYEELFIFDTETLKNTFYSGPPINIRLAKFSFISNEYIGIQNQSTLFLNLSDTSLINLKEYSLRGFLMAVNRTKDIMYAGTGYTSLGGAFTNEFPENQLEVTYSSGMLNIELPENIAQYSINILNLSGQLIANFNRKFQFRDNREKYQFARRNLFRGIARQQQSIYREICSGGVKIF
jgi:WD40 repeat protein